MSETITYLNIPKRPPSPGTSATESLFIGRKYQFSMELLSTNPHGICTDFICSPDKGGATTTADQCDRQSAFLWDADSLTSLAGITITNSSGENIDLTNNTPVLNNRFVISNTELSKPTIHTITKDQQLALHAEFDFAYTADKMDARLGTVSLVESQCFLLLKNGQQHKLLNTDEQAVLFITGNDKNNVISPILDATRSSTTLNQSWQINVTHTIPEQLNGIAVESLTVLEQYRTFFMQRELPFTDENIWTPLCLPISWGWSMRIARRYDGEWGIARQKLLMPTTGDNGMEMPTWENNSLST